MAYTSKAKIEKYLMVDIDSSFDNQITDWISGAEEYIKNYTGRKNGFEVSVAETRYFDGNGEREIDIDEFVSITTLEVLEANGGDVEWTLTEGMEEDYIVYPYNDTPQYKLILRPSSQIGAWYPGKRRIKVTGVFGHSSSVPKDIELAATILVASVIEKGVSGGRIRQEALGDYSVSFEDMDESDQVLGVKRILDKYKKFTL